MNRIIKVAVAAACALGLATQGLAQQQGPSEPVLTLEQAVGLAGTDQPVIAAFEREAVASEEAAVAARSLPDPEVSAGVENYPVVGLNAPSPTKDEMTMYTIGIMREQIRRSKREAEAQRISAEALVSRRQASAEERHVRREVMIAWVNAVEARAKQRLLERLVADLRAGRKVIEAGIPTGSSTPALVLQADAEIGLGEAQLIDAKRAESRARAELARWIGQAAYRPLPDALPAIDVLADMLPHLDAHPEVQVALAQEEVAQRKVAVARQARKSDLTWSVSVGFRPDYGEIVSAGVSIPLQINRRQRQDRLVGEALARADAARLRTEDAKRQLERDYRTAVADYEGATAEIQRIEKESVPALEAAFDAAKARVAGGGGTFDQPFAIARRYVEVTIQSVEARAKRARAAAEILHVHGEIGR